MFRKADGKEDDALINACNDTDGVIKHELHTYRIKKGAFIKEVVTRRYAGTEVIDASDSDPLFIFEGSESDNSTFQAPEVMAKQKELAETSGLKKSKGIPRKKK